MATDLSTSLLCITLLIVPSDGQVIRLSGSTSVAVAGDPFTFTCRSDFGNMGNVRWSVHSQSNSDRFQVTYFDGYNCSGTDRYKSLFKFSCTREMFKLTILDVDYQIHHQSNWTCEELRYGFRSNTVILGVNVPLLRVEITNSTVNPLTVTEKEILRVECTTNPTRPPSTILWSKDGENVTQGVTTNSVEDDGRTIMVSTLSFTVTCADRLRGVQCTGVYGGQRSRVFTHQLVLFVHCKSQVGSLNIHKDPGFGAGVGTGIAICLMLVAVAAGVLVYMWGRRGKNNAVSTWFKCRFTDRKKNASANRDDDEVPTPETGTPTVQTVYESIESSSRQINIRDTYEELGFYENTSTSVS